MDNRVEESRGSVRLRRPERRQLELSMRCVDDLVGADHPVRMVAGVVETLDLSRFYEPIQAREGVKGRDATSPELLVSLWLYGCIRGIGSARELERRCQESAAFQWLCGGVSVNYHLLSDFRTGHGAALDELFTQIIASLVERGLVTVGRVSQDGVRVRIGAGASSFRREERLEKLLGEAKQHVKQLRQQMKDPAQAAAVSLRRQGARKRAARERQQRLKQAIAQLPELQAKQAAAVQRAGNGKEGEKKRKKQLRVSTTDPQARVMKMANGGFNPAVNIQLATDTKSRAILGVAVSNEGADSSGLSAPMRRQVKRRTGSKVNQHLLDGGFMRTSDIEQAHRQRVELFIPPKPARDVARRGHELEPKPRDSQAILDWKQRMASEEGKEIYKQRAATSETVNADLRSYRGLGQITVRGLRKVKMVALWAALAYNLLHFGARLLA